MKTKIILFLFLINTSACVLDKNDRRNVLIVNKSDTPIYCFYSETNTFKYYYNLHEKLDFDSKLMILPNSSDHLLDKPRSWDVSEEDSFDHRMRFFIITKDSVDKYGWEKVAENNIYTKRYEYNIEELDSLNWTIVYEGL